MKLYTLMILAILLCVDSFGQNAALLQQCAKSLESKCESWNLTKDDVKDFVIADEYQSRHNNVKHVYINQRYQGIPVANAIVGLHYQNGTLAFGTSNFVSDLKNKVVNTKQKLTAADALKSLALEMGILPESQFEILKTGPNNDIIFKRTSFSKNDIPAQLMYYFDGAKSVRLAWNLQVDLKSNPDYYTVFVDAADGQLLSKHNYTLHCSFEKEGHTHSGACTAPKATTIPKANMNLGDGAQYRVYAFPAENPLETSHSILVDPSLESASPFGWHDTDGVDGAEYTITRGNNVHAYLDQDDNDSPDRPEPNGGPELIFDFEHKVDEIPDSSINADVTNLFYYNNFLHDFTHAYGFDEASGNFQQTNYTGEGRGSDYVVANAHDAFGLSGTSQGLNNATFSTPPDGNSGSMNMYQWSGVDPNSKLRVTAPEEIVGDLESGAANFGRPVGATAVNGKVVVVDDDVSVGTDACEPIQNDDDVDGNIAMIDRGRCEFGSKALNAQDAGAIAVLICNVVGVSGGTGEEIIPIGGGVDGGSVSIPVLFMKKSDCDLIKMVTAGGTDVELNLQSVNADTGPAFLSSSFDNGIIAHEFGHGISNRLTGGPSSAGCLGNDEQMGEGWSDFFALITSHQSGETGPDRKGIGNYVATGKADGRGIRTQVYSNDMSVNTKTYNNVRGTTAPHPLGEVWAVTLWDMYWAFIDVYGYDADYTNPDSGNSRAIQLVMDGMKLQRCSPGFLDGRDGILAADDILFGGAHRCMIWGVFARRGMGWDATQGLSNDRNDNEEGFETFPICVEQLKISKEVTDLVIPGDTVDVKLTVINHKRETLTGVNITDRVPTKLDLIDGSVSMDFVEGNTELLFNLGDMEYLDEVVITYRLVTSPTIESQVFDFDDFEDLSSTTLIQFPLQLNDYEWELIDFDGFESNQSWYIRNDTTDLDQALSTIEPWRVEGELPILKFVHKYNTERGFDGGFVEISDDGGDTWDLLPADAFMQGGYNSTISFQTFAIPALEGFTGQSDWIESFADLSAWKGEDILVRFRFGCDGAATGDGPNPGWYVDNFELLDLESYDNGQACVTSSAGDMACDSDPILVNTTRQSTSTNDLLISEYEFGINPNPVSNVLHVSFNTDTADLGKIEVYSVDGKKMMSQTMNINSGVNNHQINVNSLSNGAYILQLRTKDDIVSHKFIKN